MMFLYVLIFVCQYLYINYFCSKKKPNIEKTTYTYTLKDNVEQTATIYRTNRNAKKVLHSIFNKLFIKHNNYFIF